MKKTPASIEDSANASAQQARADYAKATENIFHSKQPATETNKENATMKTTKKTNAEENNRAEQNAKAWMDSIAGMIAAMEKAEEERDEATFDDETFDADGWRERIQECPLEISVRAGWHAPGEKAEDEEFLILLSTGGPALRIVGDLDQHNQPENPRLEYQDWGTPWTEYATDAEQDEALEKFCAQFYFGE